MQLALDDAGITADQVDYLNAHGTATTLNDANETNAIKMVYGDHAQKLSISTKSMSGQNGFMLAAVEAIACIKAIEDQWVLDRQSDGPDPKCDLDYTLNEGRSRRSPRYAMSNSFRLRRPQRRAVVRSTACSLTNSGVTDDCGYYVTDQYLAPRGDNRAAHRPSMVPRDHANTG
ncbi:MAG: hypothetical protein R3D67_10900 [Hyphomicrobiaceae bacterium]